MIRIKSLVAAALLFSAPPLLGADLQAVLPMPRFTYDTEWLKMPSSLSLGEIAAVAVDRRDHLWILHRPRTAKPVAGAAAAPPIVEFDARGRFLRAFGGPGPDYEWPDSEHSLAITTDGHVWVSGNTPHVADRGDDMLLEFDRSGRFVRQIGKRAAGSGNYDSANFMAPADIYFDASADELLVADGYGNQRLIVLSGRDGRFRHMWGAFGVQPPKATPTGAAPTQGFNAADSFNGVHGVEKSADGKIYVSDRLNQRIQVFDGRGRYLGQVSVNRGLASPATASGITFSRDRAQKYLFVADWGNGMIVVIDRNRLKVIGTIGRKGNAPGEFSGPHLLDTDSKGVIYVAEVQGRRVHRLIPVR